MFWERLLRVVTDPEKLRLAIARRVAGSQFVPFEYGRDAQAPHAQIGFVPDRFSLQYCDYLKLGYPPLEEAQCKFVAGNANNNGDLVRYYFLTMVCDTIVSERIDGDVAELGVYKGNTAYLLARLARRMGTAYLFDTFNGFPRDDLSGIDRDKAMEFADTSLPAVKALVGEGNAKFVQGYFPDSTSEIPSDLTFALVHLDCDLYAPFRAGLEYFYPRLKPGAFLVMHDYFSLYWEGVERAIAEFFVDKPERIVPIPDKSGTAVIRKL
jgi:O-methyltransferase